MGVSSLFGLLCACHRGPEILTTSRGWQVSWLRADLMVFRATLACGFLDAEAPRGGSRLPSRGGGPPGPAPGSVRFPWGRVKQEPPRPLFLPRPGALDRPALRDPTRRGGIIHLYPSSAPRRGRKQEMGIMLKQ